MIMGVVKIALIVIAMVAAWFGFKWFTDHYSNDESNYEPATDDELVVDFDTLNSRILSAKSKADANRASVGLEPYAYKYL